MEVKVKGIQSGTIGLPNGKSIEVKDGLIIVPDSYAEYFSNAALFEILPIKKTVLSEISEKGGVRVGEKIIKSIPGDASDNFIGKKTMSKKKK